MEFQADSEQSHGKPAMVDYALLKANSNNIKDSNIHVTINGAEIVRRGRPGFWERFYRRKYWAPEILCLLLATAVIVVIAAVLNHFDKQPIQSWHAPITLNDFTALMATFLYMLLVSPISSAMSQLKWVTFQRARTLYNFHVGDRASRSTFGAFLYLISGPQSALATIAAILSIATAAIGPLVQQIVHVNVNSFPSPGIANIPTARSYNNTSPGLLAPTYNDGVNFSLLSSANAPDSIVNALNLGIFGGKDSDYKLTVACATSNCTFEPYNSLSVEGECVNVTDQLTFNQNANASWIDVFMKSRNADRTFNASLVQNLSSAIVLVSLPNGFNVSSWDAVQQISPPDAVDDYNYTSTSNPTPFQYSYGRVSSMFMSSTEDPIVLKGYEGTFVNFQIIYLEHGTNASIATGWQYGASAAWECILSFADNKYSGSITSGSLIESIDGDVNYGNPVDVDSTPRAQLQENLLVSIEHLDCALLFPSISASDNVCNYAGLEGLCCNFTDFKVPSFADGATKLIDEYSLIALGASAARLLNETSSLHDWASKGQAKSLGSGSVFGSVIGTPSMSNILSLLVGQVNGTANNASIYTLPQLVDNISRSVTKRLRLDSATAATGSARITQTVYAIEWRWFSIPVLLLVLTTTLVAVTAWESKRKNIPVWTYNSLATMLHGVDNATRIELSRYTEVDDLREASKLFKVSLDGDPKRLVP